MVQVKTQLSRAILIFFKSQTPSFASWASFRCFTVDGSSGGYNRGTVVESSPLKEVKLLKPQSDYQPRGVVVNPSGLWSLEIESVLEKFKKICEVDLGLKQTTIEKHLRHVEKYLGFCEERELEVDSSESIREFLYPLKTGNQNTYGNHVKSIRVFFSKYLQSSSAKTFKIPRCDLGYVKVPSKDELRRFYDALPDWRFKALFLFYASSGRRRNEILDLNLENVDFEQRMLSPINKESQTKHTWFSFFNDEALEAYRKYQNEEGDKLDSKLFRGTSYLNRVFRETSKKAGVKVTPQVLREWFCQTMGELGVPDRFVDAFCGRVPKSVLGKRYTDYSPQRLKEIYNGARLKVFS